MKSRFHNASKAIVNGGSMTAQMLAESVSVVWFALMHNTKVKTDYISFPIEVHLQKLMSIELHKPHFHCH